MNDGDEDLLTGTKPRGTAEGRGAHRDYGVDEAKDERDRQQRVILAPEAHGAGHGKNSRTKGMKTREAGRETGTEQQHEEGDGTRPHRRPAVKSRFSSPCRSAAFR